MADFAFSISADDSGFKQALDEAKQSAADAKESIEGHMSGLNDMFGKVRLSANGVSASLIDIKEGLMGMAETAGILVAYEGLKKIGEELEKEGERATEIKELADGIGVTTDQFQAMQEAAEESGTSTEIFTRAAEELAIKLTEAREGSA